jgi:hypothetical protein
MRQRREPTVPLRRGLASNNRVERAQALSSFDQTDPNPVATTEVSRWGERSITRLAADRWDSGAAVRQPQASGNSGPGRLTRLPFATTRYSRRDWLRCCRSSAIRMPRQSMIVITADPPKLTRGRGTPTTGARPMTIIRLIVT